MTDDLPVPVDPPAVPETGPQPGGVDRKMLESLVCPVTQRPLDYDREAQELISRSANLAFPIRDGIPIMLVEEARPLDGLPTSTAQPSRRPSSRISNSRTKGPPGRPLDYIISRIWKTKRRGYPHLVPISPLSPRSGASNR